jgi:hypothetical protein
MCMSYIGFTDGKAEKHRKRNFIIISVIPKRANKKK